MESGVDFIDHGEHGDYGDYKGDTQANRLITGITEFAGGHKVDDCSTFHDDYRELR